MKVMVEIEQSDYVKAVTPFANGCSFRAIISNGKVLIEPGCYCLVNLLQGADAIFLDAWKKNGEQPFEVNVAPKTKLKIMTLPQCKWCGGLRHKVENSDAEYQRDRTKANTKVIYRY